MWHFYYDVRQLLSIKLVVLRKSDTFVEKIAHCTERNAIPIRGQKCLRLGTFERITLSSRWFIRGNIKCSAATDLEFLSGNNKIG